MNEEQFGSADAYRRAFEALRAAGISLKEVALLQAHFDAPNHTVTWAQLAERVGYAKGRAVNVHYGLLAHRVAKELGITGRPRGFWLYALADWATGKDPSGHQAFVLRRPVIEALASLGILRVEPEPQSFESVEQDFESEVSKSLALPQEERLGYLARYPKYPSKRTAPTTTFVRNPHVVAEVLFRAKGGVNLAALKHRLSEFRTEHRIWKCITGYDSHMAVRTLSRTLWRFAQIATGKRTMGDFEILEQENS